jgi:AcrR family transcriptional regulator
MPRPASDKLQRLTGAATTLTHTRGFERTTIADIAAEAGVASGSVYYYFKTKDDVGRAIVDAVLAGDADRFAAWDAIPDARDRLTAYIDALVGRADALRQFGSPVGALCTDLRKYSAELGDEAAAIVRQSVDWAAEQFVALGFSADAAAARALHLVTGMEGAALLSHALDTTEPLEREAAHLKRWIANTKV